MIPVAFRLQTSLKFFTETSDFVCKTVVIVGVS